MTEVNLVTVGPYWRTVKEVLRILPPDPAEAMTFREIAAHTRYGQSTVRNAVKAAQAAGLVVRTGVRRRESRGGWPGLYCRADTAGQP